MNPHDSPIFFNDWIKRRRKALDLTQNELARRAGCSVFALRKIESGERRPSKQLAELLAASLDISPEETQTFIKAARGEVSLDRLQAPSLDLFQETIPDTQPDASASYIPVQPTPLVGRKSELAAMQKLFVDPSCHLLTLTGMGGIGKTRLAIEFAANQRAAFPGGVFYVSLAPVTAPEAIVPAIADILGCSFSGPVEPKEQLIHFIQNQFENLVLLILDNLEHLLIQPSGNVNSGAAVLVSELLQRLPKIKILATSRERLNLRGEWTYELYGLPVPAIEYAGDLGGNNAVTLFINSARRSKADFEIGTQEQPSVIQICHLLDGIPLAIELAAAWVGVLSCEEIAQEIDANIDFLATSMRDIPERHRSIRASFDHSWKLLSDEEQQTLSQLSVFQGGFDRFGADQVAGASLSLLASLSAKSLIRYLENGRYDLHEVIRQYALAYLGANSKTNETPKRHSNYFLKFVADREQALKSASQQEALREFTDEMDNIRAAWAYAIKHEMFVPIGNAIRSLGWFFEASGLLDDGIDQFAMLVHAFDGKPQNEVSYKVLGLALMQQGLLYFRKGWFAHARNLYKKSIEFLRRINNQCLLTDSFVFYGIILHLDGEYEHARSMMQEGLACAQAGGDRWFEAYAIYNLGYVDSLQGRYAKGYEKMMAGLETWRTLGDPHSISLGLNFLVTTLISLERYEEAKSNMVESIRLCEISKNRWGMGTAYRYYGLATMAQGNYLEAQELFRKSLDIFGDYVIGWDIALSLNYLGDAMRLSGSLTEARKYYLNALQLAVESKALPIVMDLILGLTELMTNKAEIKTGLMLSYFVLDNPFSTQRSKDQAQNLSQKLAQNLTPSDLENIRTKVQSETLASILDELKLIK